MNLVKGMHYELRNERRIRIIRKNEKPGKGK